MASSRMQKMCWPLFLGSSFSIHIHHVFDDENERAGIGVVAYKRDHVVDIC